MQGQSATGGPDGGWCRMVHVASEAVDQIEYDEPTRTLFVRFTSGEWYAYFGVPPDEHAAFVAAESYGRFFQERIRPRYVYRGPLSVQPDRSG